MHHARQSAQSHSRRHRHADFPQHLARMGRHQGRADDPIRSGGDQNFHESLGLALRTRPIHVGQGPHERGHRDALGRGFGFRQTHTANLGIGVGHPGNGQGADPFASEEQGVLQDQARHEVGGVRELKAGTHVARREDLEVGRAQMIIHLHPGPDIVTHTRRFQA